MTVCQAEAAIKLIIKIISQAAPFFAVHKTNNDPDARVSLTKPLLTDMDALCDLLGDVEFDSLFNQLYQLDDKSSHLRVLPLIAAELYNQATIIRHFAMSELMGHGVAYKIAQNEGKINKLLLHSDYSDQIDEFSVREIIVKCDAHEDESLRDKSLMAAILTPVYKDGAIPDQPTIYVVWTGTYNQSTLLADLQRNAGEESFRHAEAQIMGQVMQALSLFKLYCNKPFRLVVSGHSLGGALSQLMFHSLQRHLAATVLVENADQLRAEDVFLRALHESLPDYKGDDSIGKLVDSKGLSAKDVSEMSLAVWNPTGVLQAVEDHSNKLAPMLRQYADIKHSSYIGHVGGDVVQVTGQATILSDIERNKAEMYVFKVEPQTVRATATAAGMVGGSFFGAFFFSALGIMNPLLGAGVGLALGLCAFAKKSFDAHTMKHFNVDFGSMQSVLAISYRLFTSHLPDGSLNLCPNSGHAKVRAQVSRKSMVTDVATKAISYFNFLSKSGGVKQTASSSGDAAPTVAPKPSGPGQ